MEGDEYDTAFFDKRPKFVHFTPRAAVLTSIEFDHADIYPDLNVIIQAFETFLSTIAPGGRVFAWGDAPWSARSAGGSTPRWPFTASAGTSPGRRRPSAPPPAAWASPS